MEKQVAWVTKGKGLRGAKLVEVLDHRAWGGTRTTPDTYIVRFIHTVDRNPYHEYYIAMPFDLRPVGKYTLRKLNKFEEANPIEYRSEWVSYYMLAREHIPGTDDNIVLRS